MFLCVSHDGAKYNMFHHFACHTSKQYGTIVFMFDLQPFLKMVEMFAQSHSSGTSPVLILCWKIDASIGPVILA